jgi:hypothetical protein
VETEIRQLLRSKADEVSLGLPPLPLERIARRRVVNIASVVAGVVALAVAAVTVANNIGGPRTIEPIRPDPRVSSLQLSEETSDVAVGFGSVWVSTDFSIMKIDPEKLAVTRTIACPGGLRPVRPLQVVAGAGQILAAGPDAVWMLAFKTPPGRPCETTPRPTAVATTSGNNGTFGMSIGGSIEPVDTEQGWGLVRLDPRTDEFTVTSFGGTSRAQAVVATSEAVWIAEVELDGSGGQVLRVDPKSRRVVGRIPFAGAPASIAADESGVYVSVRNPLGTPDEVVKIDRRSTRIVKRATHDVVGNIVARDGMVLLASPTKDGFAVNGLDRYTLLLKQPFYLVPAPDWEADIDTSNGRVWVTNFRFETTFENMLYDGPANLTGNLRKIQFPDPIDYLAATEDAVWVIGDINGYGVLSRIKI